MNILVTGVGGAVGSGAVKALRMEFGKGVKIVGTDTSKLAPAFYIKDFLDKSYLVPSANDPGFVQKLLDICKKEKVGVILPCTDHEVLPLSLKKERFIEEGIQVAVSPPETIKTCRDKWITYLNLSKYLPIAKSALPNPNLKDALQFVGLPVLIKPRAGWGAREIYEAHTLEEAEILLRRVNNPLLQEWLDGEEYTVDGLADKDGRLMCIVPRRRIKIWAGLSLQGVTVRDEELVKLGKQIIESLTIIGPFNFQVRKSNGKSFIFEINPRFAGTGILSVKAGVNLPALIAKNLCGIGMSVSFDFKEGLIITRYMEEVYTSIEEVARLKER